MGRFGAAWVWSSRSHKTAIADICRTLLLDDGRPSASLLGLSTSPVSPPRPKGLSQSSLQWHTSLTNPKEPRLWYGIGILYDRYGSYEHAEEAFSQVMRMAPDFEKSNEIYFRLGIIYKQQQKYASSLEVCYSSLATLLLLLLYFPR